MTHPPHSSVSRGEPDIRGGIEYFSAELVGISYGDEAMCARCGGSVDWLRCPNCGGAGLSHHDCGEDSCCCLDPEDNVDCNWCGGTGGSWHCLNTPEWCKARPLAGREHIESTALNSQAWND